MRRLAGETLIEGCVHCLQINSFSGTAHEPAAAHADEQQYSGPRFRYSNRRRSTTATAGPPGGGVPPPPPGGGVPPPPPGGGVVGCFPVPPPPPGNGKNGATATEGEPGAALNSEDWPGGKAAGGIDDAARYGVESEGGKIGALKSSTEGSAARLGLTGETEMRFPQRTRAMERPSVSTASPLGSSNLFLVQ